MKNELFPNDRYMAGYAQITKMYNEKTWQQIISYSKLEYPVTDFENLPSELSVSKKELKILTSFVENMQ